MGPEIIKNLGLTGFPDAPYRGMPVFNIAGFQTINSANNLDDHNDIYQFTSTARTWPPSSRTRVVFTRG